MKKCPTCNSTRVSTTIIKEEESLVRVIICKKCGYINKVKGAMKK